MLSVVIPSYNEEKCISTTCKVLSKLLTTNDIVYELIFVDDGSKDNSWEMMKHAANQNSHIYAIHFSKNFGKEAAIKAGLEAAHGDCVAVMDCDLQHPPEKLVDMYRLWQDGYEVIEGVKADRGKESKIHKVLSHMFYGMMSKALGFDLENTSDFKLLDRKAVDAINALSEKKPFFRALSSWVGFKRTTIKFGVQKRLDGNSKWSSFGLMKYAISNITSFTAVPMQIVTILGFLSLVISLVIGIQTLVNKMMGNALDGFTTIILVELLMGSIIMISLGITGVYISRIFEETKNRPQFIVSEVYNCTTEKNDDPEGN